MPPWWDIQPEEVYGAQILVECDLCHMPTDTAYDIEDGMFIVCPACAARYAQVEEKKIA